MFQRRASAAELGSTGLTISGSCDSSSNITVDAVGPASNDAELRIQGNDDGTPFSKNVYNFDSGVTTSLVGTDGGQAEGSGQLVYATNSGHVVTLDYGFDFGTNAGGAYDGVFVGCTLYGEAISG